tara:strand:- start:44 stop:2653 length:2610 start_codon:yes stop_codon:yes gene_type:complete
MDILLVECGATGSADVQLRLPKKLAKNFRFVSFRFAVILPAAYENRASLSGRGASASARTASLMVFAMPTPEWVLRSDPVAWETHARAAFTAQIDGECPSDVSRKNIMNYAQGSFSMVIDDLNAVLPKPLADIALNALQEEGLCEAFDLRKNLVSLKKVLLHCWHAAHPVEHELHRLATFWRNDMHFDNGFAHCDRYREICVTHMRCKGAAHAAYDGRVLTKQICCVPRHPDARRPARLRELPNSLTTRSWLLQAETALRGITSGNDISGDDVPRDASGDTSGDTGTGDTSVERKNGTSRDTCVEKATPGETLETPARGALNVFLENVAARIEKTTRKRFRDEATSREKEETETEWPCHLIRTIERVLIARGGSKALAIRDETKLYAQVLIDTANQFDAVLATLGQKTLSVEAVLRDDFGVDGSGRFRTRGIDFFEPAVLRLKEGTVFDRLRGLLQGCAPGTRDIASAVQNIVNFPSKKQFVSGDDGGADFFPAEFTLGRSISVHRSVVEKWRPVMWVELEVLVPGARIGDEVIDAEVGRLEESKLEDVVSGDTKVASMSQQLATRDSGHAWPPDPGSTPLLAYLRGKQKCTGCGGDFGSLWVQYGTCFRCDLIGRRSGRCPRSAGFFSEKDTSGGGSFEGSVTCDTKGTGPRRSKKTCPANAWCPHHSRCLACELLSFPGCSACGITSGDGEDIGNLVETASDGNVCVFLDFDRTVCATKVGASPIVEAKTKSDDESDATKTVTFAEHDKHLMSIATSHANTHVVTRNRHVADIVLFLEHLGVRDAQKKVHHVGKGASKAGVILGVLGEFSVSQKRNGKKNDDNDDNGANDTNTPSALFVDDSIAELLDEQVAAIPGLTRVLFSRVVA